MYRALVYVLLTIVLLMSVVLVVYFRQPFGFYLMAAAILAFAYFIISGTGKK